ncbi:MAG: type II secretion system protein GspM [Methylocystis sp.]|nr:type II secretion system protein GspM [Methylocystis sp.]
MSAQISLRAIQSSPLGRRAVFVGVNLLLLALFYLVVIEPARRMIADGAEDIAQRRATLARYEAVAAQEAAVQDYARQVAESNARGELIDGSSEGIVNANLQARLKTLAEQSKVTVRSIQMLPVKTFNNASLVGARLEATGSLEAVHALARALEGEPPLLIISTAIVRGQTMMWGAPIEAAQDLDAQFDVYGGAAVSNQSGKAR